MREIRLKLPHRYATRPYQVPIWRAIDLGVKRIAWVAHRRSGKDKSCLNIMIKKMMERVGAYYYVFPTYAQGRKILWDGADQTGMRFLDHFPPELIVSKNEAEMKIVLYNGSIFRIVGGDNIDSIVGTNPIGIVLSEYSLMDPLVWRFLRPILAENGGWCIFVFTPRGENHGYQTWELANQEFARAQKENKMPLWFPQMDTAGLGTVRPTGAIPQDVLDQERREYIHDDGNDALYQQEYECNFTVPISGAYYAAQLIRAYQEGRVGRVPHDPRYLVDTWWDLGLNDRMAIWFTQTMGVSLHVINYLDGTGQGLAFYVEKMSQKGFVFGKHYAPHDIKVRELTTGRQRVDTAKNLGIDFQIVERSSLMDGIDSTRALIDKCWFDAEKCADGLNALKNYQKQYDEKRKVYLKTPLHNWASNGADAMRTCAMGIDVRIEGYQKAKRDAWDPDDSPGVERISADAL